MTLAEHVFPANVVGAQRTLDAYGGVFVFSGVRRRHPGNDR
jgi:hypothetical protein